jgi:hypothetical protein
LKEKWEEQMKTKMTMNNYIQKIKKTFQSFLKDPFFLKHWEMPYYSRPQRNNQLGVNLGNPSGRRYHYYGYSSNLIEQLYTGIMPFGHMSGQRQKYPAKIEPASTPKERLIAEGLSDNHYREPLAEALYDFVRTTSHVLFQRGIIFKELVYERDASGNISKFSLEHLNHEYLFRFFGNYYQVVPWWIAKQNHLRVQVIKIPVEKVFRMKLPNELGGKRKLQRTLKRLWKLSSEIVPKFQTDAMEANKNVGFDFDVYNRKKYLEVAKLSSVFGWNGGQLSKNITEYYSLTRYLREVKAQALVREKIMGALNNFLNGQILNMGVQVAIENLPTVKKIEEQEKTLVRGDLRFMDLFNETKI